MPKHTHPIEPRWPAMLAILAVIGLNHILPRRIQVLPTNFSYTLFLGALGSMAAVGLTGAHAHAVHIERVIMRVFFAILEALILMAMFYIIRHMVKGSHELDGLQLLASSISIWVTNVMAFSLQYWQMDRGGPEARLQKESPRRPDWQFPTAEHKDYQDKEWHPTFVDYLFLSFSTATAFSPADTLPLTTRAKLLMMVESIISLVTIVVVGARAISILGS